MIEPAPTTVINPTIARGTFVEFRPGVGADPAHVVIALSGTNYRLYLIPTAPVTTDVGKRILGVIRASARRVDAVHTGGCYVEPVFGRPRRIQGRVIAADDGARVLIIDAAVPIHCTLTDARQRPSQFPVGELVSFDALDGATFTPLAG